MVSLIFLTCSFNLLHVQFQVDNSRFKFLSYYCYKLCFGLFNRKLPFLYIVLLNSPLQRDCGSVLNRVIPFASLLIVAQPLVDAIHLGEGVHRSDDTHVYILIICHGFVTVLVEIHILGVGQVSPLIPICYCFTFYNYPLFSFKVKYRVIIRFWWN